eukprot:gene3864-4248_t
MRITAACAAVVASLLGAVGHPCKTDADCGLLGLCNRGTRACACDPGWGGPGCTAAALRPLNTSLGYHNSSAASWGGLAIATGDSGGPEPWSLYVSQFSHHCPLKLWTHNSQVVRCESNGSPAGPYRWVEEVHPEFHHNPTVVGPTLDGFYLMYMIGHTNSSNVLRCEAGIPDVPVGWKTPSGATAGRIAMSYSRLPTGPWSSPRVVLRNDNRPDQNQSGWDCFVTNPSAVIQ